MAASSGTLRPAVWPRLRWRAVMEREEHLPAVWLSATFVNRIRAAERAENSGLPRGQLTQGRLAQPALLQPHPLPYPAGPAMVTAGRSKCALR
jgi:hypothetical protein